MGFFWLIFSQKYVFDFDTSKKWELEQNLAAVFGPAPTLRPCAGAQVGRELFGAR